MTQVLRACTSALWQIRLSPTEMVRKLVSTLEVWRLLQCAQCQPELELWNRKEASGSESQVCNGIWQVTCDSQYGVHSFGE